MTDFAQTMHNWKRMCEYFEKQYEQDCCDYCPLTGCGAIWEMDKENWEDFEKKINTWAAENPEPKYPTWREFIKEMGLTNERKVAGCNGVTTYDTLNEKADEPIYPEMAEKLGLKPCY